MTLTGFGWTSREQETVCQEQKFSSGVDWVSGSVAFSLPLASLYHPGSCVLLTDCWQDQGNDVKYKMMSLFSCYLNIFGFYVPSLVGL